MATSWVKMDLKMILNAMRSILAKYAPMVRHGNTLYEIAYAFLLRKNE